MKTWIIIMASLLALLVPPTSGIAQKHSKAEEGAHPSSDVEHDKQLVLRFFREVLNQRHPSLIDELYVPNVIDHSAFPGQAPGTEGIKNAVRYFLDTFSDLEVTIEDLIAEDGKVVTRETWNGTHSPSGEIAHGSVIHIFRVSDGKITDEWSVGWDWIEKLESQTD